MCTSTMHGTRFFVFTFEVEEPVYAETIVRELPKMIEIDHVSCSCYPQAAETWTCVIKIFTTFDTDPQKITELFSFRQLFFPYSDLKSFTGRPTEYFYDRPGVNHMDSGPITEGRPYCHSCELVTKRVPTPVLGSVS